MEAYSRGGLICESEFLGWGLIRGEGVFVGGGLFENLRYNYIFPLLQCSIGGQEPFIKQEGSSYSLIGFKGSERATWTAQRNVARGRGFASVFAQIGKSITRGRFQAIPLTLSSITFCTSKQKLFQSDTLCAT